MMKKLVSMAVVLLLAAGVLWAQSAGGGATSGSGGTIMVNTPKGLFVLRNGILAKYSMTTLNQAKELALFGPLPDHPADDAAQDVVRTYNADIQRRTAPALLLVKDNSLLIVMGDKFARINQDTLELEAKADLTPKDAAADTGRGGFRMSEPVPGYLLVDKTLYLMRTQELLAVSIMDGNIPQRVPLPKELQPLQMDYRGFGGGRNGGGRGN